MEKVRIYINCSILRNDCNTYREEFYTNKGEYFSISVTPEAGKDKPDKGWTWGDYMEEWRNTMEDMCKGEVK